MVLKEKFAAYKKKKEAVAGGGSTAPCLLDRLYHDDETLRSLRVGVALMTAQPLPSNSRNLQVPVKEPTMLSAAVVSVKNAKRHCSVSVIASNSQANVSIVESPKSVKNSSGGAEGIAAALLAMEADTLSPEDGLLPSPLPSVMSAVLPKPFDLYIPGVECRTADAKACEARRHLEEAEEAKRLAKEQWLKNDPAAARDDRVSLPDRPRLPLPEPLVLTEALLMHTHLSSLEITPEALYVMGREDKGLSRLTASPSGDDDSPCPLRSSDTITTREYLWSRLMQACYHLPLRSLLLGNLQLTSRELTHTLELICYLSGVHPGQEGKLPRFGRRDTRNSLPPRTTGTLEFIDLSRTAFSPEAASTLGSLLFALRSSLVSIDLSECSLGDAGVRELLFFFPSMSHQLMWAATTAPFPPPNYSMRRLNLSWNGCSAEVEDQVLQCFPPLAGEEDDDDDDDGHGGPLKRRNDKSKSNSNVYMDYTPSDSCLSPVSPRAPGYIMDNQDPRGSHQKREPASVEDQEDEVVMRGDEEDSQLKARPISVLSSLGGDLLSAPPAVRLGGDSSDREAESSITQPKVGGGGLGSANGNSSDMGGATTAGGNTNATTTASGARTGSSLKGEAPDPFQGTNGPSTSRDVEEDEEEGGGQLMDDVLSPPSRPSKIEIADIGRDRSEEAESGGLRFTVQNDKDRSVEATQSGMLLTLQVSNSAFSPTAQTEKKRESKCSISNSSPLHGLYANFFDDHLFIFFQGNSLSPRAFRRLKKYQEVMQSLHCESFGKGRNRVQLTPEGAGGADAERVNWEAKAAEAVEQHYKRYPARSLLCQMIEGMEHQDAVSKEPHNVAKRKKAERRARRAARAAAENQSLFQYIRMDEIYCLRKVAIMKDQPLLGGLPYHLHKPAEDKEATAGEEEGAKEGVKAAA